ncbi:MAG: cupin domain-containing protein [Firmicutes bacterium HGW-Firmicutes-1]|nr:MAG: cupin domain-containing protein [Firmicutes bacterium HGW-Firmicutes-1]
MHNPDNMYNDSIMYPYPYDVTPPIYDLEFSKQYTNQYIPCSHISEDHCFIQLMDYGPEPFVINIDAATKQNDTFRTALWTGSHLQLTLMSINVGEDIGLEIHPNLDQFLRIEEGQGIVKMGDRKNRLYFQEKVYDGFAFIIPAGKWHNLINTGNKPLKLYSIYAPPQHPRGTVHETKAIAEAAEENHNY